MQQEIKDVVVYTKNFPSLELIKQSLKEYSFENIIYCNDTQQCIDAVTEFKLAILMLDWEVGISDVMNILEKLEMTAKIGISPIFLFTRMEVPDFAGVVMEYHIGHMWVGELSKSVITEAIVKFISYPRFDDEATNSFLQYSEAKKAGNIDSAKTIIEDLHNKLPENEIVGCELAEFYLDTDELKKVPQALNKLTANASKSVRVLNILGRCRLKEKRPEDAIKYLSEAELLNPYNVDRLLTLGTTYLEIGKINLAELKFKSVLDLEEDNKEATSGLASSLLALGDFNQAFEFIHNLSGPGEIASVFNTAAIVAIKDGRFDDAMNLYHMSAKTIGPNNTILLAKIAFNIGLAHAKQQNTQKTYYYFALAHKYDSNNEKVTKNFTSLHEKFPTPPNLSFGKDLFAALLKYDKSEEVAQETVVQQSGLLPDC